MEKLCSFWFSIFIVVFTASSFKRFCNAADNQQRQVHIVYLGGLPKGEYSPSSHHLSILQQVVPSRFAKQALVRSYTRSFNAFAAYLTEQEGQKLMSSEGVVSVFPSRTFHPQTTRSWDFMGFSENTSRNPTIESSVIVGVLDTGVWPELESFSDQGLGPVPSKWKGLCQGGKNFTCNNKIIGARWYGADGTVDSARDTDGHGSHTASIVAGKYVKDASFYGFGQGTARGGVPSARIAAYRVCSVSGCFEADILAAFDDAIADGVDIISISIGGSWATDLYADSIAIGSFHAIERGVLTVHSAGNGGTFGVPTSSVAPWMLTVAASNTDRRIINKLVLGNKTALIGNAVNAFHLDGKEFDLIYGKDATSQCHAANASKCETGCLDSGLVKGKIVLCDEYNGLEETQRASALGTIVPGDEMDYSFVVPLPAVGLSDQDMESVRAYINSTKMPRAFISTSEVIHDLDAPVVAEFSSTGPNTILLEIFKPDITAPGVEILAAYSPVASPSDVIPDKRSVKFNILSGTSMACPHAAGAAAYVKSFHPDWSPSAIKSALMTTAWQMDASKHDLAELSYGAGHLDPVKALNPGLVYETTKDDYIKLICSLNYDPPKLGKIFGGNITCPKGMKMTPKDLNYPAMAFSVADTNSSFTVRFTRTVTNVGYPNSTYTAKIIRNSHPDMTVSVEPDILSFQSLKQQKTFEVTVSGAAFKQKSFMESASLVWSDGPHSVRSPIVVF